MALCSGCGITRDGDGDLIVDLDARSCNALTCGDDGLFVSRTDIESTVVADFGALPKGENAPFEQDTTYRNICATFENDDECERTMEVDVWVNWAGAEAFFPSATAAGADSNSRLILEYQISEDGGATWAAHAAFKHDGLGQNDPISLRGAGGTSTFRRYTIGPGNSRTVCARVQATLVQSNGGDAAPFQTGTLSVYAVTIFRPDEVGVEMRYFVQDDGRVLSSWNSKGKDPTLPGREVPQPPEQPRIPSTDEVLALHAATFRGKATRDRLLVARNPSGKGAVVLDRDYLDEGRPYVVFLDSEPAAQGAWVVTFTVDGADPVRRVNRPYSLFGETEGVMERASFEPGRHEVQVEVIDMVEGTTVVFGVEFHVD